MGPPFLAGSGGVTRAGDSDEVARAPAHDALLLVDRFFTIFCEFPVKFHVFLQKITELSGNIRNFLVKVCKFLEKLRIHGKNMFAIPHPLSWPPANSTGLIGA